MVYPHIAFQIQPAICQIREPDTIGIIQLCDFQQVSVTPHAFKYVLSGINIKSQMI